MPQLNTQVAVMIRFDHFPDEVEERLGTEYDTNEVDNGNIDPDETPIPCARNGSVKWNVENYNLTDSENDVIEEWRVSIYGALEGFDNIQRIINYVRYVVTDEEKHVIQLTGCIETSGYLPVYLAWSTKSGVLNTPIHESVAA